MSYSRSAASCWLIALATVSVIDLASAADPADDTRRSLMTLRSTAEAAMRRRHATRSLTS